MKPHPDGRWRTVCDKGHYMVSPKEPKRCAFGNCIAELHVVNQVTAVELAVPVTTPTSRQRLLAERR